MKKLFYTIIAFAGILAASCSTDEDKLVFNPSSSVAPTLGTLAGTWLSVAGVFLAWTACGLLCLGGLFLSVFSISGTWLVLGAAIGAALLTDSNSFPGWPTLISMGVVCVAVDVIE